jgi:hypothetical protein
MSGEFGGVVGGTCGGYFSPFLPPSLSSSSGTAKTMDANKSSSIDSPQSRKTFDKAARDSKRRRRFI